MSAQLKRQEIQQNILSLIKMKLLSKEMTAERAQQIAKTIVEKLPPDITLEQIYQIIPQLDDQFSELVAITLPLLREYHQSVDKAVQVKIQQLFQRGKYNEAAQLTHQLATKNLPLK